MGQLHQVELSGFIDESTRMHFRIALEARGKGRPRAFVNKRTGRADAHTDKKTLDWANTFEILATAAKRRLVAEIEAVRGRPLFVELKLEYQKPKKCSWFCTKPIDNDNAEKIVWDSLQGTFFENDNRITDNFTKKVWAADEPRITITIAALKETP